MGTSCSPGRIDSKSCVSDTWQVIFLSLLSFGFEDISFQLEVGSCSLGQWSHSWAHLARERKANCALEVDEKFSCC